MPTLVLRIEVPGFHIDDVVAARRDSALRSTLEEDLEESMHLVSEAVGLVFAHADGDSPGFELKAMEGKIVGYGASLMP